MSNEFVGVYRAQFLGVDNFGTVTCAVPAVTGDVPVTAMAAGVSTSDLMVPGALGWVSFEGGDPSLPVWMGFAGVKGDWFRSFGVLDWKLGTHSNTAMPVFSTSNMANTLQIYKFNNFTMQAGRRYAIRFSARAVAPGGYFQLFKDGVVNRDVYAPGDAGASWSGINYVWELNGSEHPGTHTWTIGATSHTTSAGTMFDDGDSASISDIGPSAGPFTIVPAPVVVVPDGWQLVGTAVPFQNSWTNFLPGTWQIARYRRENDVVRMEGLIKSGNTNTVPFTLPVGFRPPQNVLFSNVGIGATGVEGSYRFDVQSDGQIIMRGTWTNPAAYQGINCTFGVT